MLFLDNKNKEKIMEINKILEYQKKDAEILKLQMQLTNSPDRKALASISALVKESQNTSAELEKQSEIALSKFNSLRDTYNELMLAYKKLNVQGNESEDQAESKKILRKVNEISQTLSNMEKRLLALADKINGILSDYESTKKKYNLAGQKHKVHKANYEKLANEINPKIAEIEAGLSGIEKEIPTALFEKYNKKKQDKIFPVFVPEMNNSCGGCMMELPSAQIEKLAKEGFLECENCRRIIFKPQQNQ